MLIDFTDDELDLIYDCLSERSKCSDDENESELIDSIQDKMWKASKNAES
jgi:hypothetical protein